MTAPTLDRRTALRGLAAVSGLVAGSGRTGRPIFVGPLKDNRSRIVIDGVLTNADPALDRMDYLLDGIIGSTT